MNAQHDFRPDLNACLLEDRTLLAYTPVLAPVLLTTGGYVILSTPPGLSSALNSSNGGGPGGSSGNSGNIPSSFNIAGFGPSSFAIGNSVGFASLSGGRGATRSGGPTITVGSGANEVGGGGGGSPGGSRGYGSSFSAGSNFGLSSANSYGMESSPVGSISAYASTPGGGSEIAPANQTGANSGTGTMGDSPSATLPATPAASQGPVNDGSNLIGKRLGSPNPLLIGPGRSR